MPRPLVATIHSNALRHNLAVARRSAPGARVWAVVKANGYGHGLIRAMRAFNSADGLALLEVENVTVLRELGWTKPILLLEGFFEASDLAFLTKYDIETVVHCNEQIAMIERSRVAKPLNVHLKLNSGMNRLGFAPEQYRDAYNRLRALHQVGNISFMTHFANADNAGNPRMPLQEQAKCFFSTVEGLPGERSLSNSAAVLMEPDLAANWIRPGIMLYGGAPGCGTAESFGLQPAMTLTSEIIGIQQISAGKAVGYGSRFVADKPMTIGVVACGYADGYPRHAPDGTPILIDGVKTRLVGRVSMDMITVDLTEIPGTYVGSKVTLWGEGLPIDDVANVAGTIGYELMCAVTSRVRIVEE